jgi:hypothetical protein
MEISTFLPIAALAILPSLLLADWYYLGIAWTLSNTLKELPRVHPLAVGQFPAAFLYPFSNAKYRSCSSSLEEHFPATKGTD